RSCRRSDEELRAVSARTSIGHGEFIWFIEVEFRVEFVFELIAGSTDALAQWVTALNHEIGDNTVKYGAVIEWHPILCLAGSRVGPFLGTVGYSNEVLDGFWRVVAEEFYNDVASIGLDNCFMRSDTHEGYSSIIYAYLSVLI